MAGFHTSLEIELSLWAKGIRTVAGIDEAGRGPLAGPVVAAAVVFPSGTIIKGVEDSKKLTEKKREELFPLIKDQALCVGVGIVSHDVIDRINILQATILAMHKAIDDLTLKPDFVIVDGNSFRHDVYPFQNIIDGDEKSFTIAAASIIAKVTRDRLMEEYHLRYPLYGFARHKGYGTKQHLDAIRQHGLCEIHRRSFALHLG
ncbi:MAG TPA: ribonuclease HII [Bacteroidota bacterium]